MRKSLTLFFTLLALQSPTQAMKSKDDVLHTINQFTLPTSLVRYITTIKASKGLKGNTPDIYPASFTPKDKEIIRPGGIVNTIYIRNRITGKALELECSMLRHPNFSPDGKQIITVLADKTARIWDSTTGKQQLILRHPNQVVTTNFSPDGKQIITGSSTDYTVRIWNSKTGKLQHALKLPSNIFSAYVTRDGKQIVTTTNDHTVRIWNRKTYELKHILRHTQRGMINSTSCSPDGKLFATTSTDKTAHIWDRETGELKLVLKHIDWVYSANWSPDSKLIVTRSPNKTAHVWDRETGEQQHVLRHTHKLRSANFSTDGKQIITGVTEETTRTWDRTKNIVEKINLFYNGRPWRIKSNDDEKKIVTVIENKTARIWLLDDPEKKESLWLLFNQTSPITTLVLKKLWQEDQKKDVNELKTPTIVITKPEDAVKLAHLEANKQSQKVYQLLNNYIKIKYNVVINNWPDVKLLGACLPYQRKRLNLKMSKQFAQEYNSAKNKE